MEQNSGQLAARFTDYNESNGNQPLSFAVQLRKGEQPLSLFDSVRVAYEDEFDEDQTNALIEAAADTYNAESVGLSNEQLAAVYLFTAEWFPKPHSLYIKLNADLRATSRQEAQKWRFYLHHLFSALRRLPCWGSQQDLYRGVNVDLTKINPEKYKKGNKFTWYECTSTTVKMDVTMQFLQKGKPKTVFTINGAFSGQYWCVSLHCSIRKQRLMHSFLFQAGALTTCLPCLARSRCCCLRGRHSR